jgi:hypothetical protein
MVNYELVQSCRDRNQCVEIDRDSGVVQSLVTVGSVALWKTESVLVTVAVGEGLRAGLGKLAGNFLTSNRVELVDSESLG